MHLRQRTSNITNQITVHADIKPGKTLLNAVSISIVKQRLHALRTLQVDCLIVTTYVLECIRGIALVAPPRERGCKYDARVRHSVALACARPSVWHYSSNPAPAGPVPPHHRHRDRRRRHRGFASLSGLMHMRKVCVRVCVGDSVCVCVRVHTCTRYMRIVPTHACTHACVHAHAAAPLHSTLAYERPAGQAAEPPRSHRRAGRAPAARLLVPWGSLEPRQTPRYSTQEPLQVKVSPL